MQRGTPKWRRYLDTCVTGYRYFDARLACCTIEPPGFIMNKCMPAYQSKTFLYPGATKVNLHAKYTAAATETNARVVGLKYVSNVFKKGKFSVFIPRKDQCDICVSAKHGNLNQATLDKHVQAKDEASAEKAKDGCKR